MKADLHYFAQQGPRSNPGVYASLFEDLSLLDAVAALSAEEVSDFETLHSRYESDRRLRVGDTLFSYVDGNMVHVNVG